MILIVDDRHENLISLRRILEHHGYEVDAAVSGEEALKKILSKNYGLIILDVQMPVMDGFEVAEAIMGSSKTRDIPIIFLSAVSIDKKFVTRGYESGGIDYITKPVDPDVLMLKVATFVRLFQQKAQLTETQNSLRAEIEFRKAAESKKDEFISIASHELKTPLTSIKGYLQLLERSIDAGEKITSRKYLDRTLVQLEKLNNLVADLLDTSKIESGKLDFNKKVHDFDFILENALDIIRQTHPRHKILSLGKTGLKVAVDDVRIEQVIINYLTNAIKYSPDSPEVQVESSVLPDGRLQVSVRDYGIGITKEKQARIFEKYYRVEDNSNRFQGLGIGLYISAEIIRRHDGEFGVESEPGHGACFYFRLSPSTSSSLENHPGTNA